MTEIFNITVVFFNIFLVKKFIYPDDHMLNYFYIFFIDNVLI